MNALAVRLAKPVELMATGMYAHVPDLADRIGDAELGLMASFSSWKPNPKSKEPKIGSMTKWAILQAQLNARQGGRAMTRVTRREDTFIDVDPEVIGVERMAYDGRSGD